MKFRVMLHPRVERFLKRCPDALERRILEKLRQLRTNPFRLLEHYEGQDFFKLRVGDYRALVDLKDDRILIQYIDHRKRIYKR